MTRLPTTERITVRPTSQQRPRAKRLRRRDEGARVQITPRDRTIFRLLAEHRLLTAEQLRRLVFPKTQPRRVRGRLRLLYDAHLLDRVGVVAQPTAGVPPFVYTLTDESAAIASDEVGEPLRTPSSQNVSLRFIAHHVGVCEFFVALTEALRTTDWNLGEWRHEWDLKVSGDTGARRGERVHVTDPDSQQEMALTVLPDAYFTLLKPSQTLRFFFEYDRSTHRLRRWRERALAFTAYARQGHFRQRFGGRADETFRMLIVCQPDYRQRSRRTNVLRTIEAAVGESQLFWAGAVDELGLLRWTGNGNTDSAPGQLLMGRVWSQPGNRQRQAILPRAAQIVVRPRNGRAG